MNFFSTEVLVVVLIVLTAALLALCIVNTVTIFKVKNRVNKFFGERGGLRDVETMLEEHLENNKMLDQKFDMISESIESINARLAKCLQNVSLVRYNPFEDMGGDFSYALALLDENYDGIILNGLHARDYCHTYAKSIEGLNSEYPLSKEEKQALTKAAMDHEKN